MARRIDADDSADGCFAHPQRSESCGQVGRSRRQLHRGDHGTVARGDQPKRVALQLSLRLRGASEIRSDRERHNRCAHGEGQRQDPAGSRTTDGSGGLGWRRDDGGFHIAGGHRQRRRMRLDRSRQVELGLVLEDRLLELAQLRAGLERQLVDQQRPTVPVHLQGVGLAPRAVERQHELPAQPLAQRVLRNECLEFRAQFGVPPERQLRVDPLLHHDQPELFEALNLKPRKRLELEIGERPPAPQRLRRAQLHRRAFGIAVLERLSSIGDVLVEPVQIELSRLDAQQIPGRSRQHARLVAGDGERLAKARDLDS